jgi:hypothetical protein
VASAVVRSSTLSNLRYRVLVEMSELNLTFDIRAVLEKLFMVTAKHVHKVFEDGQLVEKEDILI